jgi:hypothetical protein
MKPSPTSQPSGSACVLAEGAHASQAGDEVADAAAAQQVAAPHDGSSSIVRRGQPVQIVIVEVEALLGDDASGAAKHRVQDLALRRGAWASAISGDHLGVGAPWANRPRIEVKSRISRMSQRSKRRRRSSAAFLL